MKTSGAWIRPLSGDYLIFIIALALLGWLFSHYWNWQAATRLQIHQGGQLIATLTLDQQRELSVSGPLGITRIEIDHGRARVHSHPVPINIAFIKGGSHMPDRHHFVYLIGSAFV